MVARIFSSKQNYVQSTEKKSPTVLLSNLTAGNKHNLKLLTRIRQLPIFIGQKSENLNIFDVL